MHSFSSREVGGATSQQKHAIRSSVGFGPFRAVWQTIVGRYHEQKTSFLAAKHLFCKLLKLICIMTSWQKKEMTTGFSHSVYSGKQ